ncbi:MAG: helix-turn-helix domain-containing protein [Candidatus Thorarchaeota archaeon]|jgi:hypothetical protein
MAKRKFSDVDLIAALNISNNNVTQAAKILGVTPLAVRKRRNELPDGVLADKIDDFRTHRADTFAQMQQIILRYITPDKLRKSSLQQLGTLFGIFYDKERLETGKPTEQIAHAHLSKMHPDDMKLLKQMIQQKTQRRLEKAK